MGAFKRGWCKPSAILFATECPPSERNFTVALAHAKESDAKLNLFHVAPSTARARMHYPGTNGAGPQTVLRVRQFFDPLAQRAWDMGIDCQVVLREGNAAEEILKYMGEWQVDRVVMGAHTAGPAGKPLVGSVADTLLRKAEVPVTIVSPFLAEGSYRNFLTRSVLCVVSAHQSSQAVARFAAELAMRYGARAVFQHIIPSQKQPGKQKHSVHPVSTFCQAPHEADQAMCNLLASMFDAGHWQSFKCSLHCHPRVKTREANHQFREVVNFEQSRESHFWHVTRWGIAFQERIICHVADASLEQPVTGAHAKMASYHGICWPRHAAVSESG